MSAPIDNNDASTPLEETTQHPLPIETDDDTPDNTLTTIMMYQHLPPIGDPFDIYRGHSPPPPSIDKTRSMSIMRLFELFRLHKEGHMWKVGSPWIEVPLLQDELQDLKEVLWEDVSLFDYVYCRVWHEYDFEAKKMIIRYQDNHHYAIFIDRILSDIYTQLCEIRKSDDRAAARIVDDVWLDVTSLKNGLFHRADVAIRHLPDGYQLYPRVMVEALFPPKRKSMPHLIHRLITESQGRIRLAIGFNIVNWGSKKATVSTWQPEITGDADGKKIWTCKQKLRDDCFRSEDGSAVEGNLIFFWLKDFCSPDNDRGRIAGLDIPISIPYSKLAEYLDYAERKFTESEQRERAEGRREIATTRRPMM
ncbi:hypothetical protein GP486_005640 [Trichoglossum hirsutum]|uniref:Uncharacterized protein n=1 Tax=Trichoglossum hirsutum TaxID=265104 RepID=A0A9P8L909_9PEZI|nr:hypothetical protein GP486_005640 [Trichoglossum hirsutum]